MANKEIVRFRIQPYALEAALQFAIDLLIMLLGSAVLFWTEFPLYAHLVLWAGYFVVALLLHYRVCLLAIIDSMKEDYVTETVSIQAFGDEYSFAGSRLGESHVRLFYPREQRVRRYKLEVIDGREKKKKIRAVMSAYRFHKFFFAVQFRYLQHIKITYLKRSKILIAVDLAEEIVVSKRKGKEETKRKVEIEKAIRAINRSL